MVHDEKLSDMFASAAHDGGARDKWDKELRAFIASNEIQETSVEFRAKVIAFYGKLEDVDIAKKVFDGIEQHKKTAHSIDAMMTAFVQNAKYQEAVDLFDNTVSTKRNEQSKAMYLSASAELRKNKQGK